MAKAKMTKKFFFSIAPEGAEFVCDLSAFAERPEDIIVGILRSACFATFRFEKRISDNRVLIVGVVKNNEGWVVSEEVENEEKSKTFSTCTHPLDAVEVIWGGEHWLLSHEEVEELKENGFLRA